MQTASNAPNWAQIATAAIAFAALVGAVWQIRGYIREGRRNAAFKYFERWSATENLPYIERMVELLGKPIGQHAQEARWQAWRQEPLNSRLASVVTINFFEELAGLYNKKLLDREVIDEFFRDLAPGYWDMGFWFFERQRVRGEDPKLLAQWEEMCRRMRRAGAKKENPSRLRRLVSRLTFRRRHQLLRDLDDERSARERSEARERETEKLLDEELKKNSDS